MDGRKERKEGKDILKHHVQREGLIFFSGSLACEILSETLFCYSLLSVNCLLDIQDRIFHTLRWRLFVLFSSESLLGSFHQGVFMEVLIWINEDLTLNNCGVNQPLAQKQERRKKRFKNDGPEIADSKGCTTFKRHKRRKQFKIICKETDMIKFFNNANLLFTHWVMSDSLQPHGL